MNLGVLLNPVHIQFSRRPKCFPNPNRSATHRDKQRFWSKKVLESATFPSAHSLRSRFLPWVHELVRASALSAVCGILLVAYAADRVALVAFCIHILNVVKSVLEILDDGGLYRFTGESTGRYGRISVPRLRKPDQLCENQQSVFVGKFA